MCSRYALISDAATIRRLFQPSNDVDLEPRYNIAPTQQVPVIRCRPDATGDADREIVLLRWGFLPAWLKVPPKEPPAAETASETAAANPMFRAALAKRRCLLPADAFYEWRKAKGGKQPWLFRMKDHAPFAFAGIWESWTPPRAAGASGSGTDGDTIESCALFTTEANGVVTPVADRMPAILPADLYGDWLAPGTTAEQAAAMLRPYPSVKMQGHKVSPQVNSIKHEGAALIEAVT